MNSINWPASSVWVFIAQLGEHCSANAEATGSNPVEAPKIFFSGYFRNCLNCDSLRWSHTHFKNCIYYAIFAEVLPKYLVRQQKRFLLHAKMFPLEYQSSSQIRVKSVREPSILAARVAHDTEPLRKPIRMLLFIQISSAI